MSKERVPWADCADAVAQALDADVVLLNGPIERGIDRSFIAKCSARRRRPNVFCIAVTFGGDANVAYRIARIFQHCYKHFYFYLTGTCKSAGTLLTLGANEIVVSNHGELGPLDVQMEKEDHLWDYESGLTVMTALSALHEKALAAFEHFFLQTEFKSNGRLSVRTASRIATDLAGSLFAPIYQQVDPAHVGEAYRSMAIAKQYGTRLKDRSQNFDDDTLDELISGYPSHGFVIDKIEVQRLFKNVREATAEEDALREALGGAASVPVSIGSGGTFFRFISTEREQEEKHEEPREDDPTADAMGKAGDDEPPAPTGGNAPAYSEAASA